MQMSCHIQLPAARKSAAAIDHFGAISGQFRGNFGAISGQFRGNFGAMAESDADGALRISKSTRSNQTPTETSN